MLGIGWELLYHLLMQWRWEKDWPSRFGLVTGVPEGVLIWLLLSVHAIPCLCDSPIRRVPRGLRHGLGWGMARCERPDASAFPALAV